MTLRLAYNTNGLQNHRLEDAAELVAEAGYDGLALTLDIHHLDPLAPWLEKRAYALRTTLDELGLGTVIETGARFLLDPRRKHEPTLVSDSSAGRARRVEFYERAISVAHVLGSECVSFWSGVSSHPDAWTWLQEGLEQVMATAEHRGVRLAFEPEPGMVVGDLDAFGRLPAELPLALDLGHALVTGEREPVAAIHEFAGRLGTVAIEDMRRGEHVHLPFGEGDMDIDGCLDALEDIGWRGLTCVELSRESHRAHELVGQSIDRLRRPRPRRP